MNKQRSVWLAEAAMFATMLFWGSNYVVLKFGLQHVSPEAFVLARFALVTPVIFIIHRLLGGKIYLPRRDFLAIIGIGFLGISLYQTFFASAVQDTTAATASLLLALSPIFTAMLAPLLGEAKSSRRSWFGMVLALLGTAGLLWSSGSLASATAPHPLLGDLYGICASLAWTLYGVLARPVLVRHPPVLIVAWTSLFGAIGLIPFGLSGLGAFAVAGPSGWLALLFTVFLVTSFGLVVWQTGIQRMGSVRTSVYLYLVPVIASAAGAIWIGERLSTLEVLFGGVIMGGMVLARFAQESGQRKVQDAPR